MSDNPPSLKEYVPILGSDRIWLDPLFVTVNSEVLVATVAMPAGFKVRLCTVAARRYMVGFVPPGGGTGFSVAPYSDPNGFPLAASSLTVQAYWFKLFDYGPLVTLDWWGFCSSAQNVQVIQVLRK